MEVQLVVADWCPQCPRAKAIWRMLSLEAAATYAEVDISSAAGKKLVAQFHIKAVPSVIVNNTLCPEASRDVEQARAVLRKLGGGSTSSEGP